MAPRRRVPKKLLIASVGVAAVSYVACNKPEAQPVGNLMPAPQMDAEALVPPGNLMPPPAQPDAQTTAAGSATADAPSHVPPGNLMPPPQPPIPNVGKDAGKKK